MTVATAGIGSSFDEFLREQNIYEEVHAAAVKRVIALQIAEAMKAQALTKTEMARRMETSRSQLDRLLDPHSAKVMLDTLVRAARVLGLTLRVELA